MNQASRPRDGTRSRRGTNVALLVMVPLTVFMGLFANTIGVDWVIDAATIHAVLAMAILLLAPWKSIVVRRGLRRRRRSRWMSIALMVLVLVVLATGFVHAADLTAAIGPLTVMQIHVGGAVIALVLLVLHYRSHPVRPRRTDLQRRSLVRTTGMAAASIGLLGAWELGLDAVGAKGGARRFTGSHERSSFEPGGMPSTVWLDDRAPSDASTGPWTIDIDGKTVDIAEIAAFPHDDVTAILDCTSGWYSEQVWTGVRLDRLVQAGTARSLEVRSATGYARRFSTSDLERLWLVTRVGGEPLAVRHGAPARIVAPDRRGFWWVKWVSQITTSELPWWVQSPFPAT